MNPPDQGACQMLSGTQALEWLNQWAERGLLRRIDSAWAAQVLRLYPHASPALLVAAAFLAHAEGRGHTCLSMQMLCDPPQALLGWPAVELEGEQGLHALWRHMPRTPQAWFLVLQAHCAWLDGTSGLDAPLVLGGSPAEPVLYLRRYALCERRVGQGLLRRAKDAVIAPPAQAQLWLDRFFAASQSTPDGVDWQRMACSVSLRAGLTVVTGGPGTGKTYTAARLLALLLALQNPERPLRVALAAPTGKAAARLKQSIDQALHALPLPADGEADLKEQLESIGPAKTLHSLLGARPDTRRFKHHAGNPLEVDLVIVDEASMVHLEMMDALLQALPASARLVLLGDKDQLASVEAGAVLGDLCRQTHPVLAQQTVMLRSSRRFQGAIGQLAKAVNQGDAVAARAVLVADAAKAGNGNGRSVWALRTNSPHAVCDLALGLNGQASYADYLKVMRTGPTGKTPEAHHAWVQAVLSAFDRFRVLCAVHQGPWGTQALNAAILQALAQQGWLKPQGEWFAGRPVMVTQNDVQLGVFNGDVGIALPNAAGALKVWFQAGGGLRSVSVMRLAQVESAFVMTVHKSQGSEFEHTALVLPDGGGELISRELVYTGITRARNQFTLVEAQGQLLEAAVGRPSVRASGLEHWWR